MLLLLLPPLPQSRAGLLACAARERGGAGRVLLTCLPAAPEIVSRVLSRVLSLAVGCMMPRVVQPLGLEGRQGLKVARTLLVPRRPPIAHEQVPMSLSAAQWVQFPWIMQVTQSSEALALGLTSRLVAAASGHHRSFCGHRFRAQFCSRFMQSLC